VAPGGRSAPGRAGPAKPTGKSRVILTAADLETMRTFKLDPNNSEHRMQFARERLASQRAAR
jgi:hypothetical protein